jgi:phosphoenolpyruvate synthase/pyruvate phosphate dikinase
MTTVWLDEHADAGAVGAKAHALSRILQARLPAPRGFCITVEGLAALSVREIEAALSRLGTQTVAVRSSAVEEDAADASYAGIYVTTLNVSGTGRVMQALQGIRESASSPAAHAYCRKRGIDRPAQMAAIVQAFVPAEVSGVFFMSDPIVVEASWGLGEAVVGGMVNPDRWLLSSDGSVLSSRISNKDIAIVPDDAGTKTVEVDPIRRKLPCLSAELLRSLYELAQSCSVLFGSPQDIEWAIASNKVWLLQSRPITARLH